MRKSKIKEQEFLERWWANRFPSAAPPRWNSAVTCADAVDLLERFRKVILLEIKETQ